MYTYRYNLNVVFPFTLFVAAEQLALGLYGYTFEKQNHVTKRPACRLQTANMTSSCLPLPLAKG